MPMPSHLGPYEVLCHLATGGMADVHLGRRTAPGGFEKLVVIKSIRPEFAGDGGMARAFLDEARLAATLDHPNTVTVYDAGADQGINYMAMEFLHGHDAKAVVQRAPGPVPLGVAVGVTLQVCRGLQSAHEKKDAQGRRLGIVHRDVSPHNVFVLFDGRVKVIDFGIAHASHRAQLTRPGLVKGKLGYLAPEQASSGMVDQRTDVFGAATVLYELLTRHRPFEGSNELEVLRKTLEGPVAPVTSVRPDVPAALDTVLMKALAADPAQRFASCHDFERALSDAAVGLDVSEAGIAEFLKRIFAGELAGLAEAQQRGLSVSDAIVAQRAPAPWRAPGGGVAPATASFNVEPLFGEPAGPRKRRWPWVAAAVVVAVAGTAAAIAFSASTRAERPPTEVAHPELAEPTPERDPPRAPPSEPAAVSASPVAPSPSPSTTVAGPARPTPKRSTAKPKTVSPVDLDAPLPH